MKVNFFRVFFYILAPSKKQWVSFSLVLIGYTVGIVLDHILKPLVFKEIIDLLPSNLPKDIILNQSLQLFIVICVIIIMHNIAFRIGDFAIANFESKVMKRLYDFTFRRLLQHSYHFFSNNFSGSIIAKSRRFTRSFETLIDIASFQIWFSFITLTGILIILFSEIPTLAYVFLIWSILYVSMTFLFIKKKIPYDAQEASADSFVTGRFSDAILNILNIKIFSSDKKEKLNFQLVTADEENKRRKAWNFANLQNVVQSAMMGVLQIFVLFFNIHLWYEGKISLGMFVLIQTYMFSLFDILWNLGRSLTKAMKAMTDMQEVVNIFDTRLDIIDSAMPENLKINQGHIIFKNVSFSYKGGNSVLKNFNLDIIPGQSVGL